MNNLQIAELLRDVAAAYQYKDEKKNFFKISAYQRAADAVEHATSELKDLWDEGKLDDIPGVGPSIAQHLDEIFRNGKSKHFEEVMSGIPQEAFKLMILPGIGIKTAMKMLREGDEQSLAGKAAKKEVQEKLNEVANLEKKEKRHLLSYASVIASEIIDYMRVNKSVKRIDPLGSLRRQVSTVGDIDLSVATDNPVEVLTYFTEYPKKQKIIEKGEHSASIIVPGGVQVDMIAQPVDSYGSLLQHFTGSKHHNIALREYALKKGLSLNEYGISKTLTQRKIDKNTPMRGQIGKLKFDTEKKFYNYLGMDWIPPELREDGGEIEAAREHKLPKLIEIGDVKADLQIHSSFDIETSHDLGESSMEEIIIRAGELGYEYLAFTEHNPSQKGHDDNQIVEILKLKREVVDKLNEDNSYSRDTQSDKQVIKVFNSLEIDIQPDGRIPVPDSGMETLDFALVSIHSSFQLDKETMTKRVLTALAHPKAKIFAHPTARKINEREGVDLNWPEIFEFCLKNNKWIEINSDPMRLDLPDNLVHEAVKLGVKLTLGTDAHHVDGLNNMLWGVSVARRGWAQSKDIVNTLTLTEFEKLIS